MTLPLILSKFLLGTFIKSKCNLHLNVRCGLQFEEKNA